MPFSHPHPSPYLARPPRGLHPQGLRMTSVIPVISGGGPRGRGCCLRGLPSAGDPHCLPSCSDQRAPPGSGMNLWTLDAPLPR